MFKFISKNLILLAVLVGCSDIERDNILDPKNEESFSESVILVEAFVNTEHPTPYNQWAIQALDDVESTFGQQLLVVQYHRDIESGGQTFDDPFNDNQLTVPVFKQLHQQYVPLSAEIGMGVPDIFVNGAAKRITGASNKNTVADRLTTEISPLISGKNYFTLEPSVEINAADQISLGCRVAALGNRSASALRMRLIFLKNQDPIEASRSVTFLTYPGERIDKINKGDFVDMDFGWFSPEQMPDLIIFALTSDDEKNVLQTVKWEL